MRGESVAECAGPPRVKGFAQAVRADQFSCAEKADTAALEAAAGRLPGMLFWTQY